MATDLEPLYLISGTDRPKVARAVQRLRVRVGEEAVEHLSATEASGDDAVAACNAMGLFGGGGRLVIVSDVERWKAADAKAISAYAAQPTPETVLALVAGELKRDSALAKACAKVGKVLSYDVAKKQLPEWVAEQFGLLNATAERDACRELVEIVGHDPYELSTEVQKLAAWAGGEKVTVADVQQLAAGRAETTVFELTDAWGSRDAGAALLACESLLERGNDPNRLAGLLASHVGRVVDCHTWAAEGVTAREGAGRMRKNPYYVQKLFAQAANFSIDELRDAVVQLADLDLALKGGSRLSGELELERTLVAITRASEPVAVESA
jgi:DNA polymerase III subunit delta